MDESRIDDKLSYDSRTKAHEYEDENSLERIEKELFNSLMSFQEES